MQLYEILILANPEITGDETTSLEEQIEKTLKKAKAQVKSFDRWGKYRLAYPVAKHDYGVYFLTRFEVEKPGEVMQDIHALFTVRLPNSVMRYMVTKLDPSRPLAYQKPESLEDMPTEGVDTFIREKGLLKKGGYRESRGREHRVAAHEPERRENQDIKSDELAEGME